MKERTMNGLDHQVVNLKLSDGYPSHYRLWGKSSGRDVIIMLHGGMSHSEWQTPLAQAISNASDIAFVAPDRRGCGLNQVDRGDLKSVDLLFDDIIRHVENFKRSFERVHLAGWCQGCQFLVPAARMIKDRKIIHSLILMTPGFFWSERFTSVQQIAREFFVAFLTEFNLQPDPNKPFIPVPMVKEDFTSIGKWLDYIEQDQLKTTRVSLNTAMVMESAKAKSTDDILEIDLPVLLILAERDKIVDSMKVKDHLKEVIKRSEKSHVVQYETDHAVHFEKADALAREIGRFVWNL
jgi:pimeloyl-ACP methyl ester carboxylesterase